MKSVALFFLGLVIALLIAPSATLNAQKRASSAAYVTGRVTANGTTPARSVWVIVYDGSAVKGRSLTGDDGRFYIGNLEKKTYTLVVRRQLAGGNLISQQVTPPANGVSIGLP